MSASNTITLTLGQGVATIPYTETKAGATPTATNLTPGVAAILVNPPTGPQPGNLYPGTIQYTPLCVPPNGGLDVVSVKLSAGNQFTQAIQVSSPAGS